MSFREMISKGQIEAIPGIDIDTTIYEEILGWINIGGTWFEDVGDYRFAHLENPKYSTNDYDAMKLSEICDVFSIDKLSNGYWYVELHISDNKKGMTDFESASLAFSISMAILLQDYKRCVS